MTVFHCRNGGYKILVSKLTSDALMKKYQMHDVAVNTLKTCETDLDDLNLEI